MSTRYSKMICLSAWRHLIFLNRRELGVWNETAVDAYMRSFGGTMPIIVSAMLGVHVLVGQYLHG